MDRKIQDREQTSFMGISDALLGKKNVDGTPWIESIEPGASLPGGAVRIIGRSLKPPKLSRPVVNFNGLKGAILASSEDFLIAQVPMGARSGQIVVHSNGTASNPHDLKIAQPITEIAVHPVANPAVDLEGNIFVTFSGSRGQKVPVSIYKIDTDYNIKPFISDLMNPSGIAFDEGGQMYVSSRYDGTVYRVAPNGTMSTYAEGLGVATGIAFDRQQNLYVGDRTGTIWRIARDRQIFVFATLEPSVAAYHLAFSPAGTLYVTGPTTSSYDTVHAVDTQGSVTTFYRGLGRPQGLAFDAAGNLYVAASLAGRSGIVRITPEAKASLVIAGNDIVGLAFTRTGGAVIATRNSIFSLNWGIPGLPLI
jgi:hypothetical protein